ncbi:MAG: abscisic acid-deficient protein Aba4 family protein, partial [Parvibaculaceae bacterium]
NPWLLLAGWVHYLAFDLAIGALIARRTFDESLPRLILVPILPLTFLFGPIGWLIFEAVRLVAPRLRHRTAM